MRRGEPLRRYAGLALFLATAAGLLWMAESQPTIGVHAQYFYPYRATPRWDVFPELCLLAVPLAAAMVFVLARREVGRRQGWALAAALTLGSLVLRFGTAYAPKQFPGAELAWRFLWKNTEGAYASEARAASPVGPFLGGYADRLATSAIGRSSHRVHVDVHPPGIILGFVALERFYDASPSLAAAVEEWSLRRFPSLAALEHREAFAIRHPVAVALTAAHLTILLASLTPLVCFVAVRRLWPTKAALAAAGLSAVVPGVHLFNPSVDQAYPTLTLLLMWLAARAVATRRWGWGAGLGALFYGAAFLHVGYGLVAAIVGLAALLAWRAERPEQSLREVARGYWPPVVAAFAAFLGLVLLMQAWVGYSTFRVAWLCLRNNAVFYATFGRTWWPWVAVVPFEFAVSLGFPLAVLALGGWGLEAAGAARRRTLHGRSALLLAACGVLAALDLLGAVRGETARVWLFLTPLLVVAVVDYLWRRAAAPWKLLGYLFAAQALQTLVLSVVLDCVRTTTFMMGLLGQR